MITELVMRRGLGALTVAVAAIAAGTIAAAGAADWPAKPVRIVSPFAPGGTSDTLGRLLAEQLTDKFGQNFFVENRGGAGGLIGSTVRSFSAERLALDARLE